MAHTNTIINFPGQASDERIFIFARSYPLAFLPTFALILLMIFLGTAIIFIVTSSNLIPYNIGVLLGSVFLLFMLLFVLVEFFDFYFDLSIVTDRRIVDISQKLFSRKVAELLLEDIEDVDSRTTGILRTFFNFGDVEIQTAGSKPNFNFEAIRHPNEIAAIILDLSGQARRGVLGRERHPQGPVAAIIGNTILSHTTNHINEVPGNI